MTPGRVVAAALGGLLVVVACDDKKSPAAAPKAAASRAPNSRASAITKIECREIKRGARYLVGDVGAKPSSDPDDDAAIDLPFAVEVGSAVSTSEGFAIAALKDNTAVVTLVSDDGGSGREIELSRVHGDVQPPRLASHGENLVAAIVGNDAGSSTLSLVGIQRAMGQSALTRGQEVSQGRDASTAFDVAVGARRGLLVWDRWDKTKGHGTIEALSFELATLRGAGEPVALDFAGDDAEVPRVLERSGGFWLTWVSHGVPESPSVDEAGAENKANDNGPSVLDVTPRRLKVVPLDERGAPTAEPRLVTAQDAHVLAYDAVSFGEGALLAWRDDPTTLGAEAPSIHLAKVSVDGSVTVEVVEDEQLAIGTPRLFLDREAKSEPRVWLSAMAKGGVARLGYFDRSGKLAGSLQEVAALRTNEPLALGGARFLLARPNGRALDLSVTGCALVAASSE